MLEVAHLQHLVGHLGTYAHLLAGANSVLAHCYLANPNQRRLLACDQSHGQMIQIGTRLMLKRYIL